jgi:putative nucleotidyltransferase with HDIG domain
MRIQARIFSVAVILAGIAAVAHASLADIAQGGPRGIVGYSLLVILGIVAEAIPIHYQINDSKVSSSISFIPLFTLIVLHPYSAALAALLVVAPAEFFVHRAPPSKAIFNIAQIAVAAQLAAWALQVLDPFLGEFVAFIGLSLVFFLANIAVVGIFVSLDQEVSFAATVRKVVGAGGSNLFYDVLVSPLALLVALVYRDVGVLGVLLLVLPLLIIRHSYLAMLQLQHANTALLRVLIKAIETRDPYTSGHSLRVSLLAREIAEDMMLRGRKTDQVETAALLHDIGKVDGVYAELIQKPHSLSSEEVRVIRTHATKGADFLHSLHTFNDFILGGIRHHHEKYDGSGYPDGLSGDNIPIVARIIQIADSIDAMLSDRPYRPALSLGQVYRELERCSGSQFDPSIVTLILRRGTLERALPLLREHGASREEPRELAVSLG